MLDKTREVLNHISNHKLFELYDIRFVGGTALSYYLNHRLSEDLDFGVHGDLPKEAIIQAMLSFGATFIKSSESIIDDAIDQGANIDDSYLRFVLFTIKIEFFSVPFNVFDAEDIWENGSTILYNNSKVKIASLDTVLYMKSLAFFNRKKYRDLYDIYFAIYKLDSYSVETFMQTYLKYHFTYTDETILELVKSVNSFYLKSNDEGLDRLVEKHESYEFYRQKIEDKIQGYILDKLYS